jgi:hypothetical protein
MKRTYGIGLVALLVAMPVAVWAGQADDTTVVTDGAATSDTQLHEQKRRGGHARLGNVESEHTSSAASGRPVPHRHRPTTSSSQDSTAVTTTVDAEIE